ncbi:MAG: copper-translocating P-type ATPase [Clostridiales bacterium]|nr:MAG: copper-translocating P-type ATPase [Clostridiales bacterium]
MKQKINIKGMHCAACSASVERAVKRLDGVKSANVNLLAENMICVFDNNKISTEKIIKAIEKAGFSAYTDEPIQKKGDNYTSEKTRLIISICFLIPLMYISMGHMLNLPLTQYFHHIQNVVAFGLTQLLLTLPVLYVNRKFFFVGFVSLFRRSPNMDTLVAVGSLAAVIYGIFSIYMTAYGAATNNTEIVHTYTSNLYFESAAMILTLVTVGKFLEERSKGKTNSALKKLLDLSPKTATVMRNGNEVKISAADILVGDTVIIKPGEKIPVDGTITEGSSTLDQSALTGESVPVDKTVGDNLMSASLNINGSLKMRADKVGKDTTLSQIIQLVEEAGGSKAPVARLADKISGIFVPIVMTIAFITTIIWIFIGKPFDFALSMGISVLVVSCPCALGLATPVAITVGLGKSASNGVLIKDAAALEKLHSINAVVLDKTGTITVGKPSVTDVIDTGDKDLLINIAATLEKPSEHPLSKAITEYANREVYKAEKFKAVFGKGVTAEINNKPCFGGNEAYMKELSVDISALSEKAAELAKHGKTPLYFACERTFLGIIAVADTVKETSIPAIKKMHEQKLRVIMLTGDNTVTANAIKKTVGVDEAISDVLPQDKEKVIAKLQAENNFVAMVGDGINDAPALSRADVGIAVKSGSDIALDSADIVLMKNDLYDIPKTITFGKRVMRNIRQNLFWAFFYNTLGIPIAAGILYPAFGITLSPMLAAAAMSLSSVFVVSNALRLYKNTK